MSVGIQVEVRGFENARRVLDHLSAVDTADLLDVVGQVVENQVKRRIMREKTTPEGEAWPEWSPKYAATRHGKQSLLRGEGHLVESIQHVVEGDTIEVGSNLVYAAAHQFGYISDAAFYKDIKASFSDIGGGIPARPYLGLSPANQDEIETVITDWLAEVVR